MNTRTFDDQRRMKITAEQIAASTQTVEWNDNMRGRLLRLEFLDKAPRHWALDPRPGNHWHATTERPPKASYYEVMWTNGDIGIRFWNTETWKIADRLDFQSYRQDYYAFWRERSE